MVGVVEDGKYQVLTENQGPAVFGPFLPSPISFAYLLVRSTRDPQQIAAAMRSKLHELDEGLPVDTQTWSNLLTVAWCCLRDGLMGLLATWVPAQRALSLDPLTLLREE